jgi:hypothetical protein
VQKGCEELLCFAGAPAAAAADHHSTHHPTAHQRMNKTAPTVVADCRPCLCCILCCRPAGAPAAAAADCSRAATCHTQLSYQPPTTVPFCCAAVLVVGCKCTCSCGSRSSRHNNTTAHDQGNYYMCCISCCILQVHLQLQQQIIAPHTIQQHSHPKLIPKANNNVLVVLCRCTCSCGSRSSSRSRHSTPAHDSGIYYVCY